MKEVCALLCVLSYFVFVLMIPFPILCTTLQDCGEEAAYTRTHTHTATHTHLGGLHGGCSARES